MDRPASTDREFLRYMGSFVLLGPLVGTLTIWIMIAVAVTFGGDHSGFSSMPPVQTFVELIGFLGVSLVVGYGFGLVPSALTGFFCCVLANHMDPGPWWLIACALIGATFALFMGLLLAGGEFSSWLLVFMLPGAAAASVCGFRVRLKGWD